MIGARRHPTEAIGWWRGRQPLREGRDVDAGIRRPTIRVAHVRGDPVAPHRARLHLVLKANVERKEHNALLASVTADSIDVEPRTGPLGDEMANDDRHRPGLADAAGRAAFFPARAAARAWRGRLEEAADEVLSAPEIARVVDRALAGPLPEEIARSLVRHRVLERIAAELAARGELERLVTAGLGSQRTLELTDRVLASDEMQRALRHVASSPELRDAMAQQATGLADEVVGSVRASAARLDERAEQVVRRRPRTEPATYGGIVTRAIALATDAALTIVLLMSITGVVALVASLVGGLRPQWLVGVLLGSGWMLVTGTYFVLFWSAAGQTPGMQLLRVRVRGRDGSTLSVGRSLIRFIGLVLAIVPLFAGFVSVLFTERRRGLPDFLAGTVVVYEGSRNEEGGRPARKLGDQGGGATSTTSSSD
jgi:uncharacterized RDD family membrane protein YckC